MQKTHNISLKALELNIKLMKAFLLVYAIIVAIAFFLIAKAYYISNTIENAKTVKKVELLKPAKNQKNTPTIKDENGVVHHLIRMQGAK